MVTQRLPKGTPTIERLEFHSKLDLDTGCRVWTGGRDTCGYGRIRVDGRRDGAHRVAYMVHVGPIPSHLHVCHICDNPPCINPAHLFLATIKENKADCIAKGRHNAGSRHGFAKLSEADVFEIRMWAPFMRHKDLAEMFGVSTPAITNIINYKSWQHVW